MIGDFLEGWSLGSIVGEHFEHEVLELVGEVLTSSLLPVSFIVTIHQKLVIVLVFFGFLEGKDALHDNEEDDSSGKDVNLHTVVSLLLLDFRSHVCLGSLV